jgi:hypothetical protein
VQPFEIEEQNVALGVVADALGNADPQQCFLQLHRLVAKDSRVHHARVAYDGCEFHLAQDIAVDIDSRRHLDQLHPVSPATEHATLGHVEHGLPRFACVGTVESDLLDFPNELLGFAFAQDLELAVLHFHFESAGGEGSGERERAGSSG